VIAPRAAEDGWFALELDDCQVVVGPDLDEATRARVEATRTRLGLNDYDCMKARQEYVSAYLEGDISLSYLERRSPFIARELRRQGKLREGDT
jgi:hypothetical protein